MGRNSEEESCKASELEEGEDDEALSLSDLPLNFINEEKSLQSSKESTTQVKENEEEFNFDSWCGSLSAESEMCAADEVFFKGQILPLRLSVSSDSGLLARFQNGSRNISYRRCVSRSESLDRGSSSTVGFTSTNSSRSSSTRSHYSSSSNRSNSCITNTTTNSRPKIRNQFHSFPSPKPQIRVPNVRLVGNGSRSQKSSIWDFIRLGLVRAPEIELQDVKVRNNINSSVSRNSSSGSSSTNSSSSCVATKNQQELKLGKQQKKQSFLDKRKGLFSGCKCSIAAVETVPLNNIVIIKSNTDHEISSSNSNNNNNKESNSTVQDTEKKMQDLKIKKKIKEKQAMSRHRTFEWLKELSHASYVNGNLLL